jgi:signal transduction histidine kinase
MEYLKGSISVTSKPDDGATFIVTFPYDIT